MQFFSILATSLLATLAVAAPVAEAAPATDAHSGSTELIDLWQDAYAPISLQQQRLHMAN
jgi:hypothetical protein